MKIALITDIHYGKDTNYASKNFGDYGKEDYVNVFGSQFDNLYPKFITETKDVDLVINLGDTIADEGAAKDGSLFQRCVDSLERHPADVYHVVGNHDRKNIEQTKLAAISGQPNTYFSFDQNNFHCVVLDAEWDGYPFRMLEGEMEWLREDLAKTKLPTLIFIHYPVDETSHLNSYYQKGHPEGALLKERAELRALFEAHNVRLVCFGHTHFFSQSTINGIEYVNVPSFTENSGDGMASGEYITIDIDNEQISIERQSVKR